MIDAAYKLAHHEDVKGDAFVNVVSTKPGDDLNNNPLNLTRRLIYLKKMYPLPEYPINHFDFL